MTDMGVTVEVTEGITIEKPGKKEKQPPGESQVVNSLVRGFTKIRRLSETRDTSIQGDMLSLSGQMLKLADLLVKEHRRPTNFAGSEEEVDNLIKKIDSSPSDGEDMVDLQPDELQAIAPHIEIFPLAVHDVKSKISGFIFHQSVFAPEEADMEADDKQRFYDKTAKFWADINVQATESIDFFLNPSATQDISLQEMRLSILGSTQSNKVKVINANPDHTAPEGFINFSPFLLRSLTVNCLQNIERAADEVIDDPELMINISFAGDESARRANIVFQDNSGGFSDEFINERTPGGYKSQASRQLSQGKALVALERLIHDAGGTIKFSNDQYPGSDGLKGAKIEVSFPVKN